MADAQQSVEDKSTNTSKPVTANAPIGGASLGGTVPKAMDAQGAVGKQFTEQGSIGGTAQMIGGPLDKQGLIGKHFTQEGSIGGSVQNAMGGEKKA
ncbi:Fc.00g071220.m01.CDS01 [Cosmosporella sp. VM-42]